MYQMVALLAIVVALLSFIPEHVLRQTNLRVFHPEVLHPASTGPYFEGWYFKLSPAALVGGSVLAVVPGFFLSEGNGTESHAFIFVSVNGVKQHYFKFSLDELAYSSPPDPFKVSIGKSSFTEHSISLDLEPRKNDDASIKLTGALTFTNLKRWPVSFFSLGAMGIVGWLPFLECTHGVLSFDHDLHGSLVLDEETINLEGGKGYIEKDWGTKFPNLWIWIQSNSFPKYPGTSLFFSVARIPTLGMELPGFTAAIHHENELIRFASYNLARFVDLVVTERDVHIKVKSGQYLMEIFVDRRVPHALLYAPIDGTKMVPAVSEALQAKCHLKLFGRAGEVIIDDVGLDCGLEVHNDVEWLVANLCANKVGVCL